MTPTEFTFWLDGFLANNTTKHLSEEKTNAIKEKLKTVQGTFTAFTSVPKTDLGFKKFGANPDVTCVPTNSTGYAVTAPEGSHC